MSIPTLAPAADSSANAKPPSRLTKILERISVRDFTGLPVEAEQASDMELLVMMSDQELRRAREDDAVKRLAGQVDGWLDRCVSARLPFEKVWLKNIDMYEGRQFTRFDGTRNRMMEEVAPDGRVRIAMNVCQPAIRTEMAKTASAHPQASVLPASNDDSDVTAARAGEAAWEWFYAQQKIQTRVLNVANYWRSVTGNGFTKVYYSASSADAAANACALREWQRDREANTMAISGLGAAFMQNPKPAPIMGEVTAEAVSPFHLYVPDLSQPDIQRQPYLIQVAYLTKEQAKVTYGGSLPEDWEPPSVSSKEIFEINTPGEIESPTLTIDMVRVTEVWIKPNVSRWMPEGGLVVVVGNEVVAMSKGGLPYEHGEFPFQHIYTVETGRFYRMSVLEAIIPLQNELNRTTSQLIEYKNLATNPAFYYRQGSLDPTRIRNKPGQYIPVQFGSEFPQAVPLPQMPSYIGDLVNLIKQTLDDISGQHQVSRAISPGADTAASAISILREADDDYLSNTIDSIEAAIESMARQALVLMVQFWKEPRLIKTVGPSDAVSARTLTGAEIANGTDIRVTTGTGLPVSRSARIATVTEWMDKGYIPPTIGLKAIEAGTLGNLRKLLQVDEDQAERENVELGQLVTEQEVLAHQSPDPVDPMAELGLGGEPEIDPLTGAPAAPAIFYPVNEFDNHPVHIEVHERLMKSQEFKEMPEWRQQIILEHWRAHVAAVGEFMARQQAQQASMASSIDSAQMGDESGYAGGEPAAPAGPPTA